MELFPPGTLVNLGGDTIKPGSENIKGVLVGYTTVMRYYVVTNDGKRRAKPLDKEPRLLALVELRKGLEGYVYDADKTNPDNRIVVSILPVAAEYVRRDE